MNTIVSTPYGQLKGFEDEGVLKFYGIPYAKPPVGELRFRAPQDIEPWEGVKDTLKGARCPMQTGGDNIGTLSEDSSMFSEDCLYLNVWAPKSGGKNLPVMVWIPGGGFTCHGAGVMPGDKEPADQGTRFARDENVIMVSFSYRLGALGWLNLHDFSDRFDDNLGMLDAIQALKWVNKCIAAFGGDPNNVTIFGLSAGGTFTTGLLMTPSAWPYYNKAISHSSIAESMFTVEEHDEIRRVFLNHLGLTPETAYKVADLPVEKIYDAANACQGFTFQTYFPTCVWGPVVDGKFVRTMPSLCKDPEFNKPFIIGNCDREGDLYITDYPWAHSYNSRMTLSYRAFRQFEPVRALATRNSYEPATDKGFSDILTDIMYAAPKLQIAEQLCDQVPVYVFQYNYSTKKMQEYGYNACHSADIYCIMDRKERDLFRLPIGLLREGCEEEFDQVGRQMRKLWAAFARDGKPSSDKGDKWLPYDKKNRYEMLLPKTELVPDLEKDIRLRYEGVKPITHIKSRYENNSYSDVK